MKPGNRTAALGQPWVLMARLNCASDWRSPSIHSVEVQIFTRASCTDEQSLNNKFGDPGTGEPYGKA